MNFLPTVRGEPSTTLLFVGVSWFALLIKFLIAGLTLGVFGIVPQMTATEFGTAVTLILAIWLGREIHSKNSKDEKSDE